MWRSRMSEKPRFLKEFEVWEKKRKIAELFREALEAENRNEYGIAKKKLDEIMELSKDEFPEIYFEACFKLAEVFFEEENYRGSIKCALRAICNVPNKDLYLVGIKRIRDMLFILKEQGNLSVFKENMEPIYRLLKDNEELQAFVKGLISIAEGRKDITKYLNSIRTPELKEALELLLKPHQRFSL